MKLRLLIIPALMATALFAQGPGGFRRNGTNNGPSTPPTPPTPEQAATRQANMISSFAKLTSSQSSAFVTAMACATAVSCPLTAEQTTLQGNAASLKADYATLAGDVANSPDSVANDAAAVNGVELLNLQARATAAVAVLQELATLKVTLTANQQTALVNMLVRGGGGFGGGFRGGRF